MSTFTPRGYWCIHCFSDNLDVRDHVAFLKTVDIYRGVCADCITFGITLCITQGAVIKALNEKGDLAILKSIKILINGQTHGLFRLANIQMGGQPGLESKNKRMVTLSLWQYQRWMGIRNRIGILKDHIDSMNKVLESCTQEMNDLSHQEERYRTFLEAEEALFLSEKQEQKQAA